MRLLTSVLLFVAPVLGDNEEFVSPGPSVSNSNPSVSNAVHPIRSNFHVAWSGTNSSRAVSVVLFQYDGVDLVYPFEYVLRFEANILSTDWTVATDKNLSFSNLFLFNLFYDGETSPVAVSETFNITDGSSSSSSSSSAASTSTTSSSIASTFTTFTSTSSLAVSARLTAAAAATTSAISDQSGGLSTDAKVGVGIAIPAVALVGIAVGYFFFRRRAKKQPYVAPSQAVEASTAPMQEKSANVNTGPTHEPPTYELHALSGSTTVHELSGDATRY